MGQKVVFLGGYYSGVGLSTEVRGHQRDMCAVFARNVCGMTFSEFCSFWHLNPLKWQKTDILGWTMDIINGQGSDPANGDYRPV